MKNEKKGGTQNDSWALGLMKGKIVMLSIEIGSSGRVGCRGKYTMSLLLDMLSFSSLRH